MSNLKYLGQSLYYPLNLSNGKAIMADSLRSVNQSITCILGTDQGTKFFMPEFGSRISDLSFEQNDEVLIPMLRLFISESISRWEKRVKLVDIDFERDDEVKLICNIRYKILQSNEIESLIYPFYTKVNV